MNLIPKMDILPEHLELVLNILKKNVPQFEVWVFGSRVNGNAKKFSDLDLVVISPKPMELSLSADLADAFSESDLPYKVDVVDWATTSESFRRIIEDKHMVIQPQPKV